MKDVVKVAALISLLLSASPSSAQPESSSTEPPQVGTPAPEIELEGVLQGPEPEALTLEALRGNVVVLELWATWCGPCIPALDHLAEVERELEGEPVRFIAITDETEAELRPFLERRPTPLTIGLDTDGSVFDAYHPSGRPHTVIVDPEGQVAAVTLPSNVTAEAVRDVLAGRDPDLPHKPYYPEPTDDEVAYEDRQEAIDQKTLYKAVMYPADSPRNSIFIWNKPGTPYAFRRVEGHAWPGSLLGWAFGALRNQFIDRVGLPERSFVADIIVPEADEPNMAPVKAEMVRLVERSLGVRVRREVQERGVFRLVRVEGTDHSLITADSLGRLYFRGGRLEAEGQPVSRLASFAGRFFDRPVVDATEMRGLYDFELDFPLGVEGALEEALAELGFELVEDESPVEMIVVEPADGPGSTGTNESEESLPER